MTKKKKSDSGLNIYILYYYILANKPCKQNQQIKITPCFTQDFGHGKLVQLVFVSLIQYMTKIYCTVSLPVSI